MTSGPDTPTLTDRDRQILLLCGEGLTNREIGAALHFSADTIKSRLKVLRREWGAETTVRLVLLAMAAGAIE